MAYTLNTGHALYGNLIELIGVQGGALVSHKTARTFTPESGSSFGTGTYGEHFSCVENGYSTKGASFTPGIAISTTTTTSYTVMLVFNSTGSVSSGVGYSVYLSRPGGGTVIRSPGKNSSNNAYTRRVVGAAMGSGARVLTLCRIGETAEKLYNNKVKDVDATGLSNDWADSDAQATFLGGWNSQYSMSADLVWAAFFDKELSSTEISDLYDSLGASNAFALVSSGDTTAPTLTSQSVTAVGVTTSTGNVTTNEGNGTLYGVVTTSATAPSAAQIQAGNDHTGAAAVWSGNQAVSSTGAKTFSITGLTASTAYYAHFQHKDAANNNSTVVTSAQFTTGSGAGSASGVTLTGTSTLTPGSAHGTAAGTASGATLTGTSSLTAGNATGNATGSFTTAAMENNTGAGLLANTAVEWTWYQGTIGSAPASTVHGTGTTNASGILTAAGLPISAGFLLVRTTDSSGVYYQSGTPA